ncbi:MAG: hypothetical protein H0W65_07445 [Sphingomonas sp.]|uniref:ACT domain-containing protein n=1 Tax=Sphingomonas sp. TaxID=28214 RepID=UPI0017CFF3A3|nr:ACT domain-containing protein [Sphingomonas sp.]MBA3667539.1 hypothetical protein [Sphingomonas sp.]
MPPGTFAWIMEDEGPTAVRPSDHGEWARLTLEVQSSLFAVGLTGVFAMALAHQGISANVIAGALHDHIFVPWGRRQEALAALVALSAEGAAA